MYCIKNPRRTYLDLYILYSTDKTKNMEELKFKTNIKCTGCLAKVAPALNEAIGQNNWEVDLEAPNKTLKITADASEADIMLAVKSAGFEAEKI